MSPFSVILTILIYFAAMFLVSTLSGRGGKGDYFGAR